MTGSRHGLETGPNTLLVSGGDPAAPSCWRPSAGIVAYNRFFRGEPPPYFASDEEHFLYGSVGTEARTGPAVLDLARAAADLPRAPARARRLRVDRHVGRDGPRDADRVLEGDRRVSRASASTARCATRPRSAARAQDVPTVYPAAASHQTAEQQYLRFLVRVRVRSALHCRHHPRARSRRTRSCRASIGCCTGSRSSRARGARCCELGDANAWMASRPDWGRGRIDPFNPVKFRHPGAARRRHHRQLGHDAALEPAAARRARRTTGTG